MGRAVKGRLATGRVWWLAVRWDASEPEPVPVQAEVHVIHSLPDRPERDQVRRIGAGEGRLWDRGQKDGR